VACELQGWVSRSLDQRVLVVYARRPGRVPKMNLPEPRVSV